MPSASIIVPVYNGERHIINCVESLLSQKTSFSFEIIVVDDASTDRTPELLQGLAIDNRLRVIRKAEREGSYASRNLGGRFAQGDILVFIDSDCVATPRWLEKMVSPIMNGSADAVQGPIKASVDSGIWGKLEEVRVGLYLGVNTANFALKREVFNELGGFDENFVSTGDEDLYYRLLKSGIGVHRQSDAIVYHKWPNNPFMNLRKSKVYSFGYFQFRLKYNPKSIPRRNPIWVLLRRGPGNIVMSSRKAKKVNLSPSLKVLLFFYIYIFTLCKFIYTISFLTMYARSPTGKTVRKPFWIYRHL